MAYDTQGNWIPPQEASAWTDVESLRQSLRQRGDITNRELLKDLFDVGDDDWENQDWESQLRDVDRFEILKLYKDDYEDGVGFSDDWGIQFEREQGGDDLNLRDMSSHQERYRALLGDGYDIDYAHYNNNLAYRSTTAQLGNEFGFGDIRAAFSTPRQIRAAKELLDSPGYDWDAAWVKNNAMTYSDQEVEALEDFAKHNQTRHFDSDTNITTYLNPQDSRSLSTKLYEARAAGNYNELKEPGSPQFINVIAGEVPQAEYTPEGARIVTDNDVRQIYQRYWGRDYNSSEAGVGIEQWEIDHWKDQISQNNWSYDTFEQTIANAPEAKAQGVRDLGKAYFNPNAGKEAEITGKLTAEPAPINPPDLTIKSLHQGVRRPTNLGPEFSLSDNT